MAAAPTTRWQRPVWTHRWDDDGAELPRGRYLEGVDEMVVELVEPRLRGGGVLLIWFRQGRYEDVDGNLQATDFWMPVRVAIQNEGRWKDGVRLSLSPETARSFREVPLTYLLESAQEYLSTVPFPMSPDSVAYAERHALDPELLERSAEYPVSELRKYVKRTDLKRAERRQMIDLYFANALQLAIRTHPRNPTAWLARELGISTATVRRWTAELRAREAR